MYLTSFINVQNQNLYRQLQCRECKKTPAFNYIAGCCEDSEGPYCKEHWIKWFNEYFLFELQETIDYSDHFIPNKLDEFGKQLYTRKFE